MAKAKKKQAKKAATKKAPKTIPAGILEALGRTSKSLTTDKLAQLLKHDRRSVSSAASRLLRQKKIKRTDGPVKIGVEAQYTLAGKAKAKKR